VARISGLGSLATQSSVTSAQVSDAASANTVSKIVTRDGSGNFSAGTITASAFTYSSDQRLKENVHTLTNALEKITSLRGVAFDWKTDQREDLGVIAQEVEKVFPELVHTDPVNGLKSVEYANLVAPLIESVKTLAAENAALQARVEALEKK
jgi:hypothetical protein